MQRKILNIKKAWSGVHARNRQKKLHSIPMLSQYNDDSKMKNVKFSVLYNIPCGCVLALLLVGVMSLVNVHSCSAATSASLSLSNSNMTSAAVTPGSTATVSTNVTVNVSDAESYSLSLKVDSATLKNGSTTIDAGDVTTDNTWGYKWDNASSYTAPSTTSKTLTTPALSNNATSFTKNLTFGAKFAGSAEAGTYSTKGVLSLVATPKKAVIYTLTYDTNGGSGGPSNKECEVAEGKTTCSISHTKEEPIKSGYTFLGWADTSTATTTNLRYSVSLAQDTTVYAVWKKHLATIAGFGSISNMQQMTSSICSAAPIGSTKKLTDTRDNTQYTVTKLEDGRCWMTENLRITGSRMLSSSTSNVTSSWTLPASNISSFISDDSVQAVYYDSGTQQTFYSWCAATAGTCATPDTNQNATSSICPKGWRLPTGENGGEFKVLIADALGLDQKNYDSYMFLQGIPYNLKMIGTVFPNSSSISNAGSESVWWTRQKLISTMAWHFRINYSIYFPHDGNGIGMRNGYFVRCIAE